jgi:calcineurin-like phosphoesterase family protein
VVLFSSDHHFDHANVIKYCERPFKTVEEMNETMVERWNSKVTNEDLVHYLGDFCLNKAGLRFRNRLNGEIILHPGNHDGKILKTKDEKKREKDIARYKDAGFFDVHWRKPFFYMGKFNAYLWHLPYVPEKPPVDYDLRYMEFRPKDQGQWLLHGHVHEKAGKLGPRMINVGVDVWNGYPVSEDRIFEAMKDERDFVKEWDCWTR